MLVIIFFFFLFFNIRKIGDMEIYNTQLHICALMNLNFYFINLIINFCNNDIYTPDMRVRNMDEF